MFNLGTVFGIQLKAHVTTLILAFLAAMNFYGVAVYRYFMPTELAIFMSALAGFGFCASILIHELGHALAASRFGVRCRMIVLHLLGGMALIEDQFPTPKSEFWIAIAGPFTSFVLSVLFFACGYVFPSDFTLLLIVLCVTNFILGAFNLVPAFPLDGGRVLRATLWKLTGNFNKATKWSGYTGYGFGGLLGLCGAAMILGFTVPVFGSGIGGGIWNLLMGWMVVDMAKREVSRVS